LVVLVLLHQGIRKQVSGVGIDTDTYLNASRTFWSSGNPWAPTEFFAYIYPPFLAFVLWPLTCFSRSMSGCLWVALQFGALCIVFDRYLLPGRQWGQKQRWQALAMLTVSFPVLQNEFKNGQVNLLVLALVVIACEGSRRLRGWPLGLAIGVKLTPLFVIPYLACRKRYRDILTAMFAFVLSLSIPLWIGGTEVRAGFGTYLEHMVVGGGHGSRRTFNLSAHLEGWTGPSIGGVPIHLLCAALLLGGIVFLDMTRAAPERSARNMLPAYLLGILLSAPMSQTHHLVLAMPALFVAGTRMGQTSAKLVLLAWILILAGKSSPHGPTSMVGIILMLGSFIAMVRGPSQNNPALLSST
jgi:hypothetical protein